MNNPYLTRTACALLLLVGVTTAHLQAAEVIVVQEDFEGGVLEELAFAQNANATLDITDDPAGGDRGKVGVIDLSGGAEMGSDLVQPLTCVCLWRHWVSAPVPTPTS